MIRVVLDTNILVSALITKKPSAPIQLYKAFINQQILLITSPSILAEVEDVINRENIVKYHKLIPAQRQEILKQLIILCYVTLETSPKDEIVIKNDPKDDKFILAALEGKANYIVSGDHHLLDMKEYKGIKILNPNEFLVILENSIAF